MPSSVQFKGVVRVTYNTHTLWSVIYLVGKTVDSTSFLLVCCTRLCEFSNTASVIKKYVIYSEQSVKLRWVELDFRLC